MLPGIFWIVPAAAIITVIFAIFLIRNVMKRPTGTPKMKEIGDIIFQGAWAFLKRQYSTIAMYSVAIAIIIGVLVGVLGNTGLEKNYSGFSKDWKRQFFASKSREVCYEPCALVHQDLTDT